VSRSWPSYEEAEIVQRAKQGEPAAFGELYSRYHAPIYRYILYRVGDQATAEDLAADVFVRLVERIDRFRYRGRPILAWLYTLARNLVTDYRRRSSRRPMVPLEERDEARAANGGWDAGQSLTSQMLAACIDRLTEDQRRVILLKFVEGLTNEATADVLGKPVGAVKSLQHRALAAIKRMLDEDR
jgi:RNA polymerase sigma-70 factor (ECF subfamily)